MGRTKEQEVYANRTRYAYELVKIMAEKAGVMINQADLIGYDNFIAGVHAGEIEITVKVVDDE